MGESDRIEQVVVERATHHTADEVRSTRSHANTERLFQREYFGRFLIELLQNARDAWLQHPSHEERSSAVKIKLTADHVLEVWNEGVPITPAVVLNSIGAVGEGTKEFGVSIGNKGIGFKAVLEVTLSPEIHSGLRGPVEDLVRVGFDPDRAVGLIHQHSEHWDALTEELHVPAAKRAQPYDGVPILHFPVAVAAAPTSTEFDTVIRLPFEERWSVPLRLTRADWVASVRDAIAEVSDEIVLLLGVFERIEIDDELEGKSRVISRSVSSTRALAGTVTVSDVVIGHDTTPPSRWLLYEGQIPERKSLEGWTAVGVRLDAVAAEPAPIVRPVAGDGSRAECFHLFFPTYIPARLPLLLHAYFQVDASRKGFADDAEDKNTPLLNALQALAVDAVEDLAHLHRSGTIDLAPLPGLLQATFGDTSPLVRTFRAGLLDALDTVEWVPVLRPDEDRALARPTDVLADARREVGRRLPIAFPPEYLAKQARGLAHPHPNVDQDGVRYLAERGARPGDDVSLAALLPALLRPGPNGIWAHGPDAGFIELLGILGVLLQEEPEQTRRLLEELAGQPDACVIPVQDGDGVGRRFVAPPARRQEGTPLRAILGRRGGGARELMPPPALQLDLISDDLLSDDLYGVCARLGITDYSTDTAIERMAGLAWDAGGALLPPAALAFMWRLLLQAPSQSPYGLRAAATQLSAFEPGRWFWCEPGRAADPAKRPPQRREEALGQVRLPTRAGPWRPAVELAFGADWADWLESGAPASETTQRRATAYRDLEHLAPDESSLLAAPSTLAGLLPPVGELGRDEAAIRALIEDASAADGHLRLVHALLLRLGVWEVPPLAAIVTYEPGAPQDPWAGADGRAAHLDDIVRGGGYRFAGLDHKDTKVRVVEDYSLLWPIPPGDRVFVAALERGVKFYEEYQRMVLACIRCGRPKVPCTNLSSEAPAPSRLHRELQVRAWLPARRNGIDDGVAIPGHVWWEPDAPVGAGLSTSPLRYLRLAPAQLSQNLASLLGITGLANAGPDRLESALADLRTSFEDQHLGPEVRQPTGIARQAFVGLHRLLYARLPRAGDEIAVTVAARQGVLAQRGRGLDFLEPATVFYLDRRSAFVEHFADRIPICVVSPDEDNVAASLGARKYQVEVTLQKPEKERNVTAEVRPYLHERAAAILALQVLQTLGGPSLELGSLAFHRRAQRLRKLELVQADNVVLSVSLLHSGLPPAAVGTHPNGDVYLHEVPGQAPVIYHDLQGAVTDWLRHLRPRLGRPLATLLESPAHADAFELLLRYDDDAVSTFLSERGVTPDDLERVEQAMRAGDDADRSRAAAWWTAVCAELADGRSFDSPRHPFADDVRLILGGWGLGRAGGIADRLIGVEEDEADRRSDRNLNGALAALADHGVQLHSLHDRLVKADGEGLQLERPQKMLDVWLRANGRHLATALNIQGLPADDAKKLARLDLPVGVRWRFAPPLTDVLVGATAVLAEHGLDGDPTSLTIDALAHLGLS